MIIGNLSLVGFNSFEVLKEHATIKILSEIGVIILLFEVDLESSLKAKLAFSRAHVLFFAQVLTVAAIAGKEICSLVGMFGKDINAWVTAVGMVPRGEFALVLQGLAPALWL